MHFPGQFVLRPQLRILFAIFAGFLEEVFFHKGVGEIV